MSSELTLSWMFFALESTIRWSTPAERILTLRQLYCRLMRARRQLAHWISPVVLTLMVLILIMMIVGMSEIVHAFYNPDIKAPYLGLRIAFNASQILRLVIVFHAADMPNREVSQSTEWIFFFHPKSDFVWHQMEFFEWSS